MDLKLIHTFPQINFLKKSGNYRETRALSISYEIVNVQVPSLHFMPKSLQNNYNQQTLQFFQFFVLISHKFLLTYPDHFNGTERNTKHLANNEYSALHKCRLD